jgi:hypothetical protein
MIKSRRMRWAGHVIRMVRRGAHIRYWWETQKGRDHEEDEDVDGWIVLKWTLEIGWGCIDWVHLAQDRDQCRTLVNTVMNFRVP